MEEQLDRKQGEYEKKLNDVLGNCENEKFELQKQHARVFQDLVDETNNRLKKVEDEHREQQRVMVSGK